MYIDLLMFEKFDMSSLKVMVLGLFDGIIHLSKKVRSARRHIKYTDS